MKETSYKLPLTFAITLHLLLFAVLFIRFNSPSAALYSGKPVEIVNATAIMQHQSRIPPQPKPQVTPTPPQQIQQAEQDQLEREKQIAQQKAEEEQQAVIAQKQQQQKLLQEKIAKEQALALKQQQIAKQKKQLAEKKAQLAKAKKLAEQKKKQAQLAVLKKQQAAATAAQAAKLAQQRAQQAAAAAAAQAKIAQDEMDRYKAMIVQVVSQNWLVPSNLPSNLACQLLIHVAPGGVVLSVEIASPSGDPALDQSAQSAVYKASPLPVPDGALFDKFRTLRLTVKPQAGSSSQLTL